MPSLPRGTPRDQRPSRVEGLILAASMFVIVPSAFLTQVQGRVGFVEGFLGPRKFRL